MKKVTYLILCILMLICAVTAVLCAVTVTGSGFLDLSNIARAVFVVLAVICAGIALFAFIKFQKS